MPLRIWAEEWFSSMTTRTLVGRTVLVRCPAPAEEGDAVAVPFLSGAAFGSPELLQRVSSNATAATTEATPVALMSFTVSGSRGTGRKSAGTTCLDQRASSPATAVRTGGLVGAAVSDFTT